MNEHDAYDQYGTEEGEDEGEPADDAPKPPQG
jgi:hypothetical protein